MNDTAEHDYYDIALKRISTNRWQVWWDDKMVLVAVGGDAEARCTAFADGLERGLVGSKTKLYGNSRIRLEGVRDHLQGFDSYEDYR